MQTRQSSVWLECSSHDLRLVGRSEAEHGKTNFQDAAKEGEQAEGLSFAGKRVESQRVGIFVLDFAHGIQLHQPHVESMASTFSIDTGGF